MTESAVIRSVNISTNKGTVKSPGKKVLLTLQGIDGDAHAGPWHRQVSMLAVESIRKYEHNTGTDVPPGGFGENITIEGLNLCEARPLDRFTCRNVILEVTQIGKKCHGKGCAIYKDTGNCIMPDEGIFCRVLSGGELGVGDRFIYKRHTFRLKVITLSDRAHAGFYPDLSGKQVIEEMEQWAHQQQIDLITESMILPDNRQAFAEELSGSIRDSFDFIITTGSTGLGSRDIAPDVAVQHMDREIPGIMELVRVKHGMVNPNALLSRSVAGLAGETILFTLPGSTRAVKEYMEEILKSLWHIILMIHDIDSH